MRILMILATDQAVAGSSGAAPLRLELFVGPYYFFRDRGVEVVLASPEGGAPWLGTTTPAQTGTLKRFREDRDAREAANDTLAFDQIASEDFDAAFCLGQIGKDERHVHFRATFELVGKLVGAGKPMALLPGMAALITLGDHDGLTIVAASDGAGLWAARTLLASLRVRDRSDALSDVANLQR